ncbi:MAG TPA: hypothetical protein VIX84_18395, partial [Acidimicrobiales bacterium]
MQIAPSGLDAWRLGLERGGHASRVGVQLGADIMANASDRQTTGGSLQRMLIPLALAQFICSFAGSNMNVMINDISHDL